VRAFDVSPPSAFSAKTLSLGVGISNLERTGRQRVEALFAQGVSRWRDRDALSVGGRRVRYGDLDERSNRLARRLIAEGLAAGEVVAVATGDIEAFCVALLAILKAGGAYLPIDPRHATERVHEVLLDAAPRLLLAEAGFPQDLIPDGVSPLRNFADTDVLDVFAADPLPAVGADDDAACIYFTSGSTGRPKGIEIAHRGIPYLAGDPDFVDFGNDDRIAQAANLGFDATAFEVWGALLNGACLVHTPARALASAEEIAAFFAAERITICFLTTSLFNALAAQDPDAFGSVSSLLIGGEAADAHACARVLNSRTPPARLINAYGPTEATTFAAWHEIGRQDAAAGRIPIGRPVRGMVLHVVGEDGAPAPAGQPGELWIGGPGVANRYLGPPALTDERFVRDADGLRVYRSGDLCSRREDGVLDYHGRIDEQVKIRGFRVEPADVAAALRDLPGVEDAIVLPREAAFGTRDLVGFVIGDGPPPMDQLRRDLAGRIPDYMVPALLRPIARAPLTANGKLDRRRLLEIAREAPAADGPSPDTVEARLADLWRAVLGRADIPLDADFRDLGGDSLSTINLALEIDRTFGRLPAIDDLAPPMTVRSLARRLSQRIGQSRSAAGCEDVGAKVFAVAYPWSMARMPEVIGHALSDGRWRHLQVPIDAWRAATEPGVEDQAALLERQLIAQAPEGPYTLYGHCFCGLLAFELACRLIEAGRGVSLLVMVDSYPAADAPPSVGRKLRRFLALGWKARAEAILRSLRSAPPATLEDVVRQACARAASRYRPRPYGGRMVFFRHSHEPDLALKDQGVWRRLARDYAEYDVDFHEAGRVTGEKVEEGYRRIASILETLAVR
jgi:amino acid adenylation domain-containing protein